EGVAGGPEAGTVGEKMMSAGSRRFGSQVAVASGERLEQSLVHRFIELEHAAVVAFPRVFGCWIGHAGTSCRDTRQGQRCGQPAQPRSGLSMDRFVIVHESSRLVVSEVSPRQG